MIEEFDTMLVFMEYKELFPFMCTHLFYLKHTREYFSFMRTE